MKETLKDVAVGLPVYMYILLGFAGLMMLISFLTPPLYIIEKSVISAVSILLGFGWVYYVTVHISEYAQNGAKIRAQKGDAILEIGAIDEKQED